MFPKRSKIDEVTLVTAYFSVPSKHKEKVYIAWMENFLTTVDSPMVIFTDQKSFEVIRALRNSFMHKTTIIVSRLQELFVYRYKTLWNVHWEMDHEQAVHSPELFMIWAEKSHFVQQAISLNPYDTEFFAWSDIGCFRNRDNDVGLEHMTHWPNSQRFKADSVTIASIQPFVPGEQDLEPGSDLSVKDFKYVSRISGGIFGGGREALNQWATRYYETLELFFAKGRFAGKDQNIMANICCTDPNLIDVISPPDDYPYDPWYYLQYHFA